MSAIRMSIVRARTVSVPVRASVIRIPARLPTAAIRVEINVRHLETVRIG